MHTDINKLPELQGNCLLAGSGEADQDLNSSTARNKKLNLVHKDQVRSPES